MKITKSKLKQLIKEEATKLEEGMDRRQELVSALRDYYNLTIGEAELLMRKLESLAHREGY